MYQSSRRATFKTSAWSAMSQANAGVSVVNAASSSVSVIHTDMLPAASVISSAAAMGTVAASASTPPASASESAPIATEKADNSLNTSKAADFSAAFFGCKLKSLGAGNQPASNRLRHAARNLRRSSHVRGACSAQPLHEPEGPDRNERENEKCSAGQESRRCAFIHDILQGVDRLQFLFATNEHLRRVCHVVSLNQIKSAPFQKSAATRS